MKKTFSVSRIPLLWLILTTVAFVGCSKDSDGETALLENPDPGGETGIVSGNPELNTFLITSNDESVVTVDAQTGEEEVIFTFEDLTELEVMPEYDNGRIFISADDNSVNAIDFENRSFVWDTPMLEYDFNSLGVTEPVCLEGICYAVGGTGVVVALDENTGDVKWYYSTNPDGELDDVLSEADTPIVYGDKVYLFSDEGFISDLPPYLHILDKETGNLVEKIELPYEITGTPLFINNTLYLPAKNLYAVDAVTLETLWVFEAEAVGTPAVSNGLVVFQANPLNDGISSKLYCLGADTGNLQWQVDTGFDRLWSPLIVENVVFGVYDEATEFAFSRSGRPFAVSLSDGQRFWSRDDVSIDHSPVYANGRLFFHGHDFNRTDDTDNNVGLLSMDANTGEVLWLNNSFRYQYTLIPLVVAQNGVFGPSYYRGN
ncbi:PQQ-like beta-propeller repeat protein [Flavobacteriaceae bacterium TP-CH-4]|uniref:PQQ-like beta-propeller repeat protein n=1 Tax=Pelagihabitans pacificus TaxID=2696054 RepID=A0A967ASR8_9FLAO|nr:PQQ-binding-like beta-propeller repeat protein [Pelagihabitans pacificus]NHF58555.1 PQQ-like beta-propeller repeat protein [Pelagihabitans pacificus]